MLVCLGRQSVGIVLVISVARLRHGGSCELALDFPGLALLPNLELLAHAIMRLFKCFDLVIQHRVLVSNSVIVQICSHEDFALQVEVLVDLGQLLLEFHNVITGVWVQLLEFKLGLVQCISLVWLPGLLVVF